MIGFENRCSSSSARLGPTAVNSILAESRRYRAQGCDLAPLMRGRAADPGNRGAPAPRNAVARNVLLENQLARTAA